MQFKVECKILCAVVCLFFLFSQPAVAATPAVYTNENFWDVMHDAPLQFWQDSLGNFYGTTESGKTFSQVSIVNNLSVRLQKFSIDEAFFYVSDKGTIRAENDVLALSIYLSLTS